MRVYNDYIRTETEVKYPTKKFRVSAEWDVESQVRLEKNNDVYLCVSSGHSNTINSVVVSYKDFWKALENMINKFKEDKSNE